MKKYYRISFPQDSKYGIGIPECKENEDFEVPNEGRVLNWKPITLVLKGGPPSDYQGSNPTYRVCSKKLKLIIEEHQSPQDEIQWLPMILIEEEGKELEYFILHFPESYDVIDKEKSIIFGGDQIVKPIFSLNKINGHEIFNYDPFNFLGFVISESVKKGIEKAGCTNLSISKVPMVD